MGFRISVRAQARKDKVMVNSKDRGTRPVLLQALDCAKPSRVPDLPMILPVSLDYGGLKGLIVPILLQGQCSDLS